MRSPTLVSLTIGLIVLSGVFWLIERLRPALPHQRRRGVDTRMDVAYWFFTPLVTRAVTRLSLALVFAIIAWSQGLSFDDLRRLATTRQTWASSLPLYVQVPLILLLADLLSVLDAPFVSRALALAVFTRCIIRRRRLTGFRPFVSTR